MKIGVNGRFLNQPYTGIGQYTKNLLKSLAELDKKNEYLVVVSGKVDKAWKKIFPANVTFHLIEEISTGTAGMKKTWWEQVQVPGFFKKEKVDIAFFPYPSNPWTKDWSKYFKIVLTVHDCIPWLHKEYRRGVLSKMYHAQSKKAVKNADLVLTVSEDAKADLVALKIVEKDKVKVAYNDAAEGFKKFKSKANSLLKKLGAEKNKYLFYCGGYDKRKNVDLLVQAFLHSNLPESGVKLIMAGGRLFESDLYASFAEFDQQKSVVKTGFLKEEELAYLYANCLSFVSLSKKEGFNIPIVEAANLGAALVLSDTKLHREVAGKSALFVDTSKPEKVVNGLEKILKDEVLQAKLREESKELAKKYSWKKSAQVVKSELWNL